MRNLLFALSPPPQTLRFFARPHKHLSYDVQLRESSVAKSASQRNEGVAVPQLPSFPPPKPVRFSPGGGLACLAGVFTTSSSLSPAAQSSVRGIARMAIATLPMLAGVGRSFAVRPDTTNSHRCLPGQSWKRNAKTDETGGQIAPKPAGRPTDRGNKAVSSWHPNREFFSSTGQSLAGSQYFSEEIKRA